jgi:hypothetical protein
MLLCVLGGVAVGFAGGLVWEPAPDLLAEGLTDGDLVNAERAAGLQIRVETSRAGTLDDATLALDGDDVTSRAAVTDTTLTFDAAGLPDGQHRLVLRVPRRAPMPAVQRSWDFTVDATPPDLAVTEPTAALLAGEPARIAGAVEEGVELTFDGEPVEVTDGAFAVDYPEPPAAPVAVVATDAAGNRTENAVTVAVIPSRVTVDEARSVHVSFYGWATPSLRDPILAMVDRGEITSVQLDLKDESGMVGYPSQIERALQIGAVDPIYDLAGAVAELHARGVHVIGRIVAFRDPVFAEAAWNGGEQDLVLQTPSGEPYAGYGGFTNFAHPVVRQYNIDIALEAASLGVDDILYDYVRRPDGAIENLVVPGLEGTPEQAIAGFLAESDEQLEPYGVGHGASVYGIAATRPTEIAQDIPAMAQHLDYIAPMVYPSHWGPGEYDVANPNAQPYDIVRRSLDDFTAAVAGTDARIVPWLQDFSLGVTYGPVEVRAQIDAARDAGIAEWIMWDPKVTYTAGAYVVAPPPAPEASPPAPAPEPAPSETPAG